MKDDLGDRMKFYEKRFSLTAMPRCPIIVRVDGKTFHTFTSGLKKPYDERLCGLMQGTMMTLVEYFNASVGYTQSDEITLVLEADWGQGGEVIFNGKHSKIVSIAAALATASFNKNLSKIIPEKADSMPLFDARAFSVPDREEAINCLIWREIDARRNSVSAAAQAVASHKELHGLNALDKLDILRKHGIDWEDYPVYFKRGIYCQRQKVQRPYSHDEIDSLPPKHEARANPNLVVERTETTLIELPPLADIINREGAIFEGEDALVKEPVSF